MGATSRRLTFGVVTGSLFVASAIAMGKANGPELWGYPTGSVLFFIMGSILFLRFVLF
jgi:hypothetical protein